MSKEKFTQGEWEVNFSGESGRCFDGIVSCGSHDLAIITGENYNCVFGGFSGDYSIEQRVANGNLMVAAPDMYNELKSLRAFLFGMTAHLESKQLMIVNQRILNIDDKLSKARGE